MRRITAGVTDRRRLSAADGYLGASHVGFRCVVREARQEEPMSSEHDDRDTKPATGVAGLKEYRREQPSPAGCAGPSASPEPAWPAPVRAKPGAANVLFIVLDDTGFGQLGAAALASATRIHSAAWPSPVRHCVNSGSRFGASRPISTVIASPPCPRAQ
jgi:hypothetical protein